MAQRDDGPEQAEQAGQAGQAGRAGQAAQSRGRGRPRQTELDERIRQAAMELVRERGPEAVTIAGVSGRSGLARTTIQRRFPDRRSLLDAVLGATADRGAPPDGLDLPGRVEWVLARTEEVLASDVGPGGVAAVLTDTDPEFTAALRRALEDGLRPVREQVAADVDRGALVDGLDPDVVLDLVLGSYLAHSVRRGAPSPTWRRATVATLARLLTPTS